MLLFFVPRQMAHAPAQELHNGAFVPYAETPARAAALSAAMGAPDLPTDHGDAPILAVHDAGYVWPVVARRSVKLTRIDALVGRYSMGSSTPSAADSWTSAFWSTQSALSPLDAVLAGDKLAVGLCRTPGHHPGADYLGGYCFINQAAVAAPVARDAGIERVAILDIDYHHGNGTQDIFWNRGDVFYASVHADPAMDFPFYWGHADETGEGEGQGATLNLPLPQGTTIDAFRAAQATALEAIARFDPGLLIVRFGADTFAGDPIATLRCKPRTMPCWRAISRWPDSRQWS